MSKSTGCDTLDYDQTDHGHYLTESLDSPFGGRTQESLFKLMRSEEQVVIFQGDGRKRFMLQAIRAHFIIQSLFNVLFFFQ